MLRFITSYHFEQLVHLSDVLQVGNCIGVSQRGLTLRDVTNKIKIELLDASTSPIASTH